MDGYEEKFVAQGIHMIFNGELGDKWEPNENKVSKFVIIGINLNHGELKKQFEKLRIDFQESDTSTIISK
jgi:G3E family GTPase